MCGSTVFINIFYTCKCVVVHINNKYILYVQMCGSTVFINIFYTCKCSTVFIFLYFYK